MTHYAFTLELQDRDDRIAGHEVDFARVNSAVTAMPRVGLNPYALGMRASLPDAAALEITDAFYAYLLQGRSIEESVRRVRAGLANNALLPDAAWLAGLPVLYSSRPASEPALSLLSLLAVGEPTINPDPIHLEVTCDLTAIPAAAHFVGRVDALDAALNALTGAQRTPLVVIHGLGGYIVEQIGVLVIGNVVEIHQPANDGVFQPRLLCAPMTH